MQPRRSDHASRLTRFVRGSTCAYLDEVVGVYDGPAQVLSALFPFPRPDDLCRFAQVSLHLFIGIRCVDTGHPFAQSIEALEHPRLIGAHEPHVLVVGDQHCFGRLPRVTI